jgi:L-ascorbate metabolism protein UlaG (beta-lactamase superfamily)
MKNAASLVLAWIFSGLCAATGVADFKSITLPESARAEAGKNTVSVMFIGVSTLLFDDGETAIMTDGYFSRPGNITTALIEPDRARIARALQRAGVKSLAAVVTMHSHFDHALDSPVVAQETGALLVGSKSTANIARGYGFAQERTRVMANGESVAFGKFKLTFVFSSHLPANFALGEISAPLKVPAKASDFKVGEAYSLLIEHEGRTMLVQGSAGFSPGTLAGRKADVVFLGVGGLAPLEESYKDSYWKEVVQTVGARRVVPIHWDNFYKSLDEPLVPFPGFERAMEDLISRGKKDQVEVRLQTEWKWVDPFAGLAR